MENIEEFKQEYDKLLNQLSDPELISDWKKLEKLLKRKNYLEETLNKQKEIQEIKKQIQENQNILSSQEGIELASLAEEELKGLTEKKTLLEKELENFLNGKVSGDESNNISKKDDVIIEIRAGTGGDEAGLFVADLFKMYSKYAYSQGWQQKILDSHPTEVKGFKEIVFELKNGDIFSKIKYEGGVHRVQRIPKTEKSGRIHTSTATVAVLLKPKKSQIEIDPSDLKIDTYKSSGAGGQNVNKRMTAIRITHLPSGLVVTSQTQRNQLQNKENALSILSARLLEKKEREEQAIIGGKRKIQIGEAKRAEKIRTYNFPQDRITDHRIKKSWSNIEEIMEGKLDKIIKAMN
ncbi:MAG: peptide chain release factor 1 [Patescibacteria group bacterium]|nr:peptide chain release factor 1 [Patescibacteria group bacterium]